MITKIAFLDPGHGGIINGVYQTAPDKMFHHEGLGELHGGGNFYEGVWNRIVVLEAAKILTVRKIPYLFTVPFSYWQEDISLKARVQFANKVHDPGNGIFGAFFSVHSNSYDGSARGFEVYTSIGETESDVIASYHYRNVEKRLGNVIRMRPGYTGAELDKEEQFYVLRRTRMPAILIEHLFFDNFQDVILLMNPEIIKEFAEALVETIEIWMKGEIVY